ncbi:MAG: sulfotransferase [Rubricoccaceae bacterium]|nr:sulfotransferase [Rubricoccaceae bacterium]
MPRPSFFIAGHSKSGTTALARFLGQHPALFLCSPKEPNYFCPSFWRVKPTDRRTEGAPRSAFEGWTEAEYLALFDGAAPGQRCGEASAAYLYSDEAAERIHAFDPEARIIMIFREPVSFLRSYHLQLLKNAAAEGETVRDLGEAIRLEPARRRGEHLPEGCRLPEFLYYTTDRLAYDVHYDRFAAVFPEEQILALLYDDFRSDNAGTVRRVFSFLGVDPAFEPAFGEHNMGGRSLRSRRAQAWMHQLTMGRGPLGRVKPLVKALVPPALRRRATRAGYERFVYDEAPPVDPAVAAHIRAAARPHVEALGERLGRDLIAEWGYASVSEAAV